MFGVATNRQFLQDTAGHPVFAAGEANTGFIAEFWEQEKEKKQEKEQEESTTLAGLAALLLSRRGRSGHGLGPFGGRPSSYLFGDLMVVVSAVGANTYEVICNQERQTVRCIAQSETELRFESQGLQQTAIYAFEPDGAVWVQLGVDTGRFADTLLAPPENTDSAGSGNVLAPMPGAVIRVNVAEGGAVQQGEPLLVLEAMKMEHVILAPFDGMPC